MRNRISITVFLLTIFVGGQLVSKPAQGQSVRASLFVIETGTDETEPKATSFGTDVTRGSGKQLHVFTDASKPFAVLIVAFDLNKNTLYRELPPVFVETKAAFSECSFPQKDFSIEFDETLSDCEILVAAFKKSDDNLVEVRELLKAMDGPEQKGTPILALQSAKLRKMFNEWIRAGANKGNAKVPYRAASVAAVRRTATSSKVQWQEHAYQKEIEATSPVIFSFPVAKVK